MKQDYFHSKLVSDYRGSAKSMCMPMSFLFHWWMILFLASCVMLGTCSKNNPTKPEEMDDGSDLTIRYIQRLPQIDYVWNSNNPAVEGWPAVGQEVTWQAHVVNWADHKRNSVTYAWFLDGEQIAAGAVDISACSEVTIDLSWFWTFDRHEVMFVLDPANTFTEDEERNNQRAFFTDALTVGFYVEQSLYDYFRKHQHKLNIGSVTFDDWAHRQIDRLNEMFANAIYPTSPAGVLDRVRIDKITVVPDGALPLAPLDKIPPEDASPWSHPNVNDRTVDMQWGFPTDALSIFENRFSVNENNPFYFHGTLLHELGHARYLTDVYAFRILHGVNGDSVLIKENEVPIVGTSYMPGSIVHYSGPRGDEVGLILYRTNIKGLMNKTYTYIDQHSAAALNLIAGNRAVCGNYNEPCNIGKYLNDLPAENRLTIHTPDGKILAGANVQIFQALGDPGASTFYTRRIDDVPDIYLMTDNQGQILLGHNPFSSDQICQDWEVANTTAIIRVEHEGRVGYSFLDVSLFNLAYWEGYTDLADYKMTFQLFDSVASFK
ncbi:MAG: hypothetical protein JSV49_04160 [Thermoplasmata archaeon]|nr:MAG: hypothetical protein JSV49_04160 [Thermoplasmata archaeon]